MDTTDSSHTWTDDIEDVLKNILSNCNELQRRHKSLYLYYQSSLKYFQVPLIILASINSVLAVSLANYISQSKTSLVNCVFSLVCACISSIQMFLKVDEKMKQELSAYYNFKLLALKIGATLKLEPRHRDGEGGKFLDECLNEYKSFLQTALVFSGTIPDKVVELVEKRVIRNVLGEIDVRV